MARAELAQRCPRPLARAMAGAELARRAMAGNFLAQHTVAAVQSEKLSESDVDRAKAERRRSPAAASVNSRRRRGPARRTTRLGHALEHLPAASCGWTPSARSGTVVQVPVQRRLGELMARNAGAAQHYYTSSSSSCSRDDRAVSPEVIDALSMYELDDSFARN